MNRFRAKEREGEKGRIKCLLCKRQEERKKRSRKRASFIKQPEEIVQKDSANVLHAPSLPAREGHLQKDINIKTNYHKTTSLWFLRFLGALCLETRGTPS